jgi:predicted regulator of Ras-like GTPase activity (Roadblock/LC7/MglB family)
VADRSLSGSFSPIPTCTSGRVKVTTMFKESLQSIIEKTDGSLGALIMGADGLAVERFFTEEGEDANLDVAAAELTSLIRSAGKSGKDLDLGELCELVVSLGKVTFVMRLFNRDYFAVLALKPDGNLGRGRYELRKAELVLAKEFAV